MTLAQIRTLVAAIQSARLDNYAATNVAPSDANYLLQINWALRSVGVKIQQFKPNIGLILAASTCDYDLRTLTTVVTKRVLKPYTVYINHNPLRDARGGYGLWSHSELVADKPSYRNTTTNAPGTPSKAVYLGAAKMILDPSPSSSYISSLSANDGTVCYIAGTYLPADLSADVDVPDVPEEVHEAIAQLAAIRGALPVCSDAEAYTILGDISRDSLQAIEAMAADNARHRMPWGTTDGAEAAFVRM